MRSLQINRNGAFKALLLAGGASALVMAGPALAQDEEQDGEVLEQPTTADPDASGPPAPGADTIIVTGSRIVRQDFQGNSPIVTVDESLFQNSSTAAIESNLNKLPQFTPAQTPTMGGDIQPTATNTPGAATVSLRGLGANRNLVLVDGRRATPGNATGVVDITTIPTAAIERVEVITGGASATYGADAIGGVANFILKKNFVGLELDGQASMSQRGDGFEFQVGGIMGTDFDDGRGNVSIAMSMNKREASYQRDRPWYRDLWANPDIGGTQFFLPNAGISLSGVDAGEFFNIFDQANPNPGVPVYNGTGDPDLNSSYNCEYANPENPIDSGICVPINVGAPGAPFVINVTGGPNFFTAYANEDGTMFTGTGFAQRGGAYRFNGPLDGYNYKLTSAGTIAANNTDFYLTLPLTRYNMFMRGNYEINDWIGVFGQGMYSHVSTYTRNEGSPIVGGWSASIPYGFDVYEGNADLGIPSSVNADGTTNAAYLAGGQFGLMNCPEMGGCPKYVVFPLPEEFEQLMLTRTDPEADVGLNYLFPEPRETFSDVSTYSMLAGFEGVIPGTDWTWETFVQHGESETFARQTGVNSLARMRALFSAPNWGQGFSTNSNPSQNAFGANFATCTSGYNIFDYNTPVSEDCKMAIKADLKNRSTIRQTIWEANFQGGVIDLPAGQVRAALGATYRELDYEFINDTLTSQGVSFLDQAQGIYPSGDNFGALNVKELYGELLIPVLADMPFVQELTLELGGRLSDYNTTGTSATYKVQGSWQVNDWLRFRGGYNRAERAPNIAELYLAPQQTFGFNSLGDICSQRSGYRISANPGASDIAADVQAVCSAVMDATAGAGSSSAYYGQPLPEQPGPGGGFAFPTLVGNADLVPEKADTWTAGFVIQSPSTSPLLSRLRFSADWFNIKIDDAIGYSPGAALQVCFDPFFNPLVSGAAGDPAQAAAAAQAAACDGVDYQPGTTPGSAPGLGNITMTYTNAGVIDISGIDAQLDWGIDAGPGTINLNVVANYYLHYKVAELASNPLVDYTGTAGTSSAGLNANGAYEYRVFTTLGYNVGPAYLAVQWQHYPSIEDTSQALFDTPQLGSPAYNVFALNGSYAMTDNVNLRFGVENLFDKAPPLSNVNPANDPALGQLPGGSFNGAHDTLGRRFYLGANVRF